MAHSSGVNRNRLREFEVGTYRELLARSVRGDGLDIHHVLQKQIGLDLIPGYSEVNGICIAIRASEHRKIPTLRSSEIAQKYRNQTARQILADDIWRNRKSGVIPSSVVLQALRAHLELYPHVYEKPGGSDGVRIDARSVLTSLQQAATNEITQEAARQASKRVAEYKKILHDKAQACLSTGNRLSRLPANVQQLLRNNGKANSSTNSSESSYDSMLGTYIIHQEYDPVLGCNLTLTVRIEYVRSETREEVRGRTKTVITTRYYRSILEWK